VTFFASLFAEVTDMAMPKVIERVSRDPVLYVSYGLSQASSSAVDILILLFVAKVLYAPQQDIGFLDALGTIVYTVASVAFGILWQRAPHTRLFVTVGFFSLAIPIFLFSSIVGTLWIAYALTALFSILMVLPSAFTATYLSETHTRSQWASICGKLGASSSLGSAFGLLLAVGWLAISSQIESSVGLGQRTLFMALGMLTVLSAVGAWYATLSTFGGQNPSRLHIRPGNAISLVWRWLGRRLSLQGLKPKCPQPQAQSKAKVPTEPVLSDSMMMFLFLVTLIHVGVGMAFTGTFLYIIDDLKASASISLLIILIFRLAAYLVSGPTGNHLNQLMPLRLQQIAGSWRFLAMAALGLVALVPAGSWSLAAIIPLVALYGIGSGIMGVTGPVVASRMVSVSKQPQAFLMVVASSNAGAGVGAWLASIAAPSLGFPVLLGISALIIGGTLLLWHRL